MADSNKQVRFDISTNDNTKPGFDSAVSQAKSAADTIKVLFTGALAFAGIAGLGDFFKGSVAEATKAQESYVAVGNALKNIGADANSLTPKMMELSKSLAFKTGMNGDEVAGALANLIRRTGDYQKSVEMLPRALDVAAARHMDLAKASDTVAKAMDGNAKAQALMMGTQGAADAQAQTFAGTLGRLKEGWRLVEESVGNNILDNQQFTEGANKLVDVLGDVAKWVEANSALFNRIIGYGISLYGVVQQLGIYVQDLLNRAFGDTFRSVMSQSDSLMAKYRDTLLYVAAAMWEVIKPFANLIGAILPLANSGLADFVGIVVDLATDFKQLGAAANVFLGSLLNGLAVLGDGWNAVLGKTPLAITQSALESLHASAGRMVNEGIADFQRFGKEADQLKARLSAPNTLNAPSAGSTHKNPVILGGPGASDNLPDKKAAEEAQKAFDLAFKSAEALTKEEGTRAQGLMQLSKLLAQQVALEKSNDPKAREQAIINAGAIRQFQQKDEEEHFKKNLDALKAGLSFSDLRSQSQAKLNELLAVEKAISEDTTKTLDQRNQALTRTKEAQDALNKTEDEEYKRALERAKLDLRDPNKRDATRKQFRQTAQDEQNASNSATDPDQAAKHAQRSQDALAAGGLKTIKDFGLGEAANEFIEVNTHALQLHETLTDLAGTALPSLAEGFASVFATVGQGGNIFASMGKAAMKAAGQAAMAEGRVEIGRGIAAGALALMGNPAAAASAAQHFLAGGLLTALGAELGGIGGGSSSGGGSGGSSGAAGAQSTANNMTDTKTPNNVTIVGRFNPTDPEWLDELAQSINAATDRRVLINYQSS